MSKYRNIRTNGYASKREANRAAELQAVAKAGIISDLREQVRYVLLKPCPPQYPKSLSYIADFVYVQNGVTHIEDSKGFRTAVYKIKARLMKQLLGLEIEEV